MLRLLIGLIFSLAIIGGGFWYFRDYKFRQESSFGEVSVNDQVENIPLKYTIKGLKHVYQTFNNCSSVALLISLSKYAIETTQDEIAEATRPWNNHNGDNDDKSVTLYELSDYAAETYKLATYVRPNGTIDLLKKFVANDIPVIARTLTDPNEDYVHYRVVKGYDQKSKIIIESNGLDGPNKSQSYDKWMRLWKDYNYSYLVIVPKEKSALVEKILGEEKDEKVAWQNALRRAEADFSKDPKDHRAQYNIVTALYYLGDYERAVKEFEKIEPYLSEHKLWYQDEPIYSYFKLGDYDRVLSLIDKVIGNRNKSVSELYVIRGKIYLSRGDLVSARSEFEKAIYYNKSLKIAREALASLDVQR